MVSFYFETKLKWTIDRNFNTKLEIKEHENPDPKKTNERTGKPLKDKIQKYIANNYVDEKYLKNTIPIDTLSYKRNNNNYTNICKRRND